MNTIQLVNFAIDAAGLSIGILGLVISMSAHPMGSRTKRFFTAFFAVLVAYIGFNLLGQLTGNNPGAAWGAASKALLFAESVASSLLMLMLTGYLLGVSGEERWWRSPVFFAVAAIWAVYFALLVYTQFSVSIYYFDKANTYHRGPLYPLLLVPPVLIMAADLIALYRRRGKLTQRQRTAFAVYFFVPMLSMLVQMLFYGVCVIVLGTAISSIYLFGNIQREQMERFYSQEEENTRLRVDIMLSQIQPHFLFNTLGAIEYLCRDNPEARGAIHRFTRFLRGNMDSLSRTEPIPFSEELEHTRAFLELEQLRFGENLNVVYDLQAEDFLLPTLTLQPLAENAVEHGVRGREGGAGTVTIATRETPDFWEIAVSDDGPGFDPENLPEDDRTHIGLQNVHDRVRRVSGGELKIESEPGYGCRATILLPKRGGAGDADIHR